MVRLGYMMNSIMITDQSFIDYEIEFLPFECKP